MTDAERIAALEHALELHGFMHDAMMAVIGKAHARTLAMQVVLENCGAFTPGEVAAKMQEIELHAEAELELAPEHAEYRELRRRIHEAGGESPR